MDDYVTDAELFNDFRSEKEEEARWEIGECGEDEDYGEWEDRVLERTNELVEAAQERARQEEAEYWRLRNRAGAWN